VQPLDRLHRLFLPAAGSPVPRRDLPDEETDAEQDQHGLDVVGALDLHRER
jgi:hypothetical protein